MQLTLGILCNSEYEYATPTRTTNCNYHVSLMIVQRSMAMHMQHARRYPDATHNREMRQP